MDELRSPPGSAIVPPNPLDWLALLGKLSKALAAYEDKKADPLEGIGQALNAVTQFVSLQDEVKRARLAVPLISLQHALSDVLRGGKSKLFDRRAKNGGPDVSQQADQRRALVATCIALLIERGLGRDAASSFVAREVNKRNLEPNPGKALSQKGAMRLYDENGGTLAAKDALAALNQHRPSGKSFDTDEKAKTEVKIVLDKATSIFPLTPPS